MTCRLILMRHCKSDWRIGLEDHERPLNPRGQRAAQALGDWLRDKDYLPDQALVSDAARTSETFARLALGTDADYKTNLYLAPPNSIWAEVAACDPGTLLLIGHNPGIGDLATALAQGACVHPSFSAYPSGATAVFDGADWNSLRFRDFVVPRDLTD